MRTAGRSLFRECANGSPKLHPSVLSETAPPSPEPEFLERGLLCYIPPSPLSPLLARRRPRPRSLLESAARGKADPLCSSRSFLNRTHIGNKASRRSTGACRDRRTGFHFTGTCSIQRCDELLFWSRHRLRDDQLNKKSPPRGGLFLLTRVARVVRDKHPVCFRAVNEKHRRGRICCDNGPSPVPRRVRVCI
jgi:hypothetical protein